MTDIVQKQFLCIIVFIRETQNIVSSDIIYKDFVYHGDLVMCSPIYEEKLLSPCKELLKSTHVKAGISRNIEIFVVCL